jgi:hypothetical protein
VNEAQQIAAAAGPWAALLGVLVAGLYSILRGSLVPASQVDRITVQWEARLAESHERELAWRQAYEHTEAARSINASQLGELMTLARSTEALLRALPQPPRDHRADAS